MANGVNFYGTSVVSRKTEGTIHCMLSQFSLYPFYSTVTTLWQSGCGNFHHGCELLIRDLKKNNTIKPLTNCVCCLVCASLDTWQG